MAGTAKHRGFGHVRKLPSKRWQASYIGPDLARHAAQQTFDTREDAEGWLTPNTHSPRPTRGRRRRREAEPGGR